MSGKDAAPAARTGATAREALVAAGGLGRRPGALPVVDADGVLRGLLTDGDVRRHILRDASFLDRPIDEAMTRDPVAARGETLAASAWRVMKEHHFDEMPVVDDHGRYLGLLDVQDLLKAGFAEGDRE
jgi:arabinose-5-phosphate isomerase